MVPEDKMRCDVCLWEDDCDGDEIVICDTCNHATHQSCYGSEIFIRLPDEDESWHCVRCKHLNDNLNRAAPKCYLCPDLKGIIKPTGINSNWAHV